MQTAQFDLDLIVGHDFEQFVLWFVRKKYPKASGVEGFFPWYDIYVPERNKHIECKFDRMSKKTGNLAIEYECRGKKSGISTTDANIWAIGYYDKEWKMMMVPVEILKGACQNKFSVTGGDDGAAKMYLLNPQSLTREPGVKVHPIEDLIEEWRKAV